MSSTFYVKVKKPGFRANPSLGEMTRWCRDNGIYYQRYGHLFMFEDKDNALLFILSWADDVIHT